MWNLFVLKPCLPRAEWGIRFQAHFFFNRLLASFSNSFWQSPQVHLFQLTLSNRLMPKGFSCRISVVGIEKNKNVRFKGPVFRLKKSFSDFHSFPTICKKFEKIWDNISLVSGALRKFFRLKPSKLLKRLNRLYKIDAQSTHGKEKSTVIVITICILYLRRIWLRSLASLSRSQLFFSSLLCAWCDSK